MIQTRGRKTIAVVVVPASGVRVGVVGGVGVVSGSLGQNWCGGCCGVIVDVFDGEGGWSVKDESLGLVVGANGMINIHDDCG